MPFRQWSTGPGTGNRRCFLPPEQIPIELRIEQLLARMSETEAIGFDELFADAGDRAGLIVTFLALLEMIRLKLGAGVSIGIVRAGYPGVQTRASAGRPASHRRSGRVICAGWPHRIRRMAGWTEAVTEDDERRTDRVAESAPRRFELKAIVDRGADLRLAGAPDAEGDFQAARVRSRAKDVQGGARRSEARLRAAGRPAALVEVAGGYQIVTRSDLHELGSAASSTRGRRSG